LIGKAPNFEDNTLVLLILPGFEDRVGYRNWKREPLDHSREVTGTIRILYNNPDLTADFIYLDIDVDNESTLTIDGLFNSWTGLVTPYQQIVAFQYDNDTGRLDLLEEIPPRWVEGAVQPIKLNPGRILKQEIDVPLRQLLLN
jgi:hypothetical protein